jgi:hypothetical protein
VELYLHSPNAPSWGDAQLGGAQGQLYMVWALQHTNRWRLRPLSHIYPIDRGQSIPVLNYLSVIFGKTISQRIHIDIIAAKAFRTLIHAYPLPKIR